MPETLRLAELIAALTLATDVGMGARIDQRVNGSGGSTKARVLGVDSVDVVGPFRPPRHVAV